MDLTLNNLQRLICHKTQTTNLAKEHCWSLFFSKVLEDSIRKAFILFHFIFSGTFGNSLEKMSQCKNVLHWRCLNDPQKEKNSYNTTDDTVLKQRKTEVLLFPPSFWLNNTTTALLQEWIWY